MKNSLRSLAVVSAAIGFLLFGVQGAAATSFTLASAVALNNSGVVGSINPVTDLTGPFGLTSEDVSLGNDFFVVDLTLNAGSASIGGLNIAAGAAFNEPIGAGAMLGAGTAPSSVTFAPFDPSFFTGGFGIFDFLPGQINAGETTVRLFVSLSPGELAGGGQTAGFMISSGADFTVQGIVVIPEPNTVTLLAGGLLILGAASRRRFPILQ